LAPGSGLAAVCVGAFAVHPALASRERSQHEMIAAIYQNTSADALVLTNIVGTRKLIATVYGDRVTLEITIAPGQTIPALLKVRRNGYEELVTFTVENLPHGVMVDNIGLNGILIPKGESERQQYAWCISFQL
jgi:hypothetical protein